jgi:TIR domain
MGVIDDFWDDVLRHIRHQELLPVAGPDVTVVKVGNTEQTCTTLIGQRLAERYRLPVSPGTRTMDEAVAAVLRARGRDEVDRVYRVVNDIIEDYPAPGDALRDLAAIDEFRLFVTMTPDRLLAKAINEVRFEGREMTRELTFYPNRATIEQSQNAQAAAITDTVVLNLFGRAASTAEYAIHEEDRLEWLHALLTETASLPNWLDSQLKHHAMLFIGCEIPDWIGRFLLRMSSETRLWDERNKQFFFVGPSTSHEASLSNFFTTYCRQPLVQQLPMEPTEFVAELHARWKEQRKARPPVAVGPAGIFAPDAQIFISYMREDADAARRLHTAITERLHGDVWLDERRLLAGDAWKPQILTAIRETIRLFVPIISANTEAAQEGYVFSEWREAVDRSRSVMGRRFIVPVIVDNDYAGDPSRYKNFPPAFKDFQFGLAPAGEPDANLHAMLKDEIRNMRRLGAA